LFEFSFSVASDTPGTFVQLKPQWISHHRGLIASDCAVRPFGFHPSVTSTLCYFGSVGVVHRPMKRHARTRDVVLFRAFIERCVLRDGVSTYQLDDDGNQVFDRMEYVAVDVDLPLRYGGNLMSEFDLFIREHSRPWISSLVIMYRFFTG
jgi:hypothetical protein